MKHRVIDLGTDPARHDPEAIYVPAETQVENQGVVRMIDEKYVQPWVLEYVRLFTSDLQQNGFSSVRKPFIDPVAPIIHAVNRAVAPISALVLAVVHSRFGSLAD